MIHLNFDEMSVQINQAQHLSYVGKCFPKYYQSYHIFTIYYLNLKYYYHQHNFINIQHLPEDNNLILEVVNAGEKLKMDFTLEMDYSEEKQI